MGNILVVVLAWMGPLVMRVLSTIGIGVITYTGYSVVMANFEASILANIGGLPSDILAYMSLGGFTTGVGILLGALAARVVILSVPRLGRV